MTEIQLKVVTAGSVDDGKSTLIGRLLHDCRAIPDDQLSALEAAGDARGTGLDLSLLTDGLRAEREQGITIDVAYRYFATPGRSFVLIDSPGHVQYTRNMVTGASNADVALLLVDVRSGITEQTRRHAAVASVLRVPHVVLVVNKMDLVDWEEESYRAVEREFTALAASLGHRRMSAVPISALRGDNVVTSSSAMPWYTGGPLMGILESAEPCVDRTAPARLPVQTVLRAGEYRGYAGRVESGVLRAGDEVVVLPSGRRSRIAGIDCDGRALTEAAAGRSVSLRLSEQLDVARGDLIASADTAPVPTREFSGVVCWFAEQPLVAGTRVLVRHGCRVTRAIVPEVTGQLDLASGGWGPAGAEVVVNALARVTVRTLDPLPVDPYESVRATGAFLLLDEYSGDTLAAGMAGAPVRSAVPA